MRPARRRWSRRAIAAPVLAACLAAIGGCRDARDGTEGDAPFPSPFVIEVTGRDFQWHLRYPGDDGKLHTGDDLAALRHIRVPTDSRVRLELRSDDYLYQLAFPDFRLKEIAVPDLEFALEFDSGAAGTFELRGDQFCGYAHPDLMGELVVLSENDFRAWLEALHR